MRWRPPGYLESFVYNRAGKTLATPNVPPEQFGKALEIVGDWRAAHAYPLHAIMMGLRTRAYRYDKDALVVQRSKRLASIIPKLNRMRLTQIQDIGGCRAVVRTLKQLTAIHGEYVRAAGKQDKRRPYMEGAPDDYIANPKPDGYRSIHYVYRYRSEQENYQCFNDLKVEIQLRTRAQHSWATALEIVDMFTGERLKTDLLHNKADPRWKRFFALMSTVIAKKEGCPPVPDTPIDEDALALELRTVSDDLDAVSKLEGYGAAVMHIGLEESAKGGAYLIILDKMERQLEVKRYEGKALAKLEADYLKTEQEHLNDPGFMVVQVTAKSIDDFQRAYPNYDLDTSAFVETLRKALEPTYKNSPY